MLREIPNQTSIQVLTAKEHFFAECKRTLASVGLCRVSAIFDAEQALRILKTRPDLLMFTQNIGKFTPISFLKWSECSLEIPSIPKLMFCDKPEEFNKAELEDFGIYSILRDNVEPKAMMQSFVNLLNIYEKPGQIESKNCRTQESLRSQTY